MLCSYFGFQPCFTSPYSIYLLWLFHWIVFPDFIFVLKLLFRRIFSFDSRIILGVDIMMDLQLLYFSARAMVLLEQMMFLGLLQILFSRCLSSNLGYLFSLSLLFFFIFTSGTAQSSSICSNLLNLLNTFFLLWSSLSAGYLVMVNACWAEMRCLLLVEFLRTDEKQGDLQTRWLSLVFFLRAMRWGEGSYIKIMLFCYNMQCLFLINSQGVQAITSTQISQPLVFLQTAPVDSFSKWGGRVIYLFQNEMGGFFLIGQFCQFDLTIIQQVKINKMWYLKKTAESVWNASKNLVDKRTPVQKLIDSIAQSQQQILPTNKLSELSTLTYEVDAFDEIVTLLFEKLKKFHYDLPESQKTLNILVATNYIIKHGATGFVDEFRKYVYMFKKYEQLEPKRTYEDLITQSQLDANLQKIKSRAHHISELLSNKQKLLKQKQLSMLVKQKLKLYEKSKLSTLRNEQYSNGKQRQENKQQKKVGESDNSNLQSTFKNIGSKTQQLFKHPEDLSIKLEGLLQTYVWKYVDKLDETIESASDKVMQQIDKYVLGEHDKFEMEDEEKEQQSLNSNKKLRKQEKPREVQEEVEDDDELMKRLEEEAHQIKQVEHADLLEFEQVKPREQEKPKPIEDLL